VEPVQSEMQCQRCVLVQTFCCPSFCEAECTTMDLYRGCTIIPDTACQSRLDWQAMTTEQTRLSHTTNETKYDTENAETPRCGQSMYCMQYHNMNLHSLKSCTMCSQKQTWQNIV